MLARGGEPLLDPKILQVPRVARRPELVLLPVLHPGRSGLRRAAVPVRRTRALRDPDRGKVPAAVDRPDPRGSRHPQALPQSIAAPGGPARFHCAVRRPRDHGRPAPGRRGSGDNDLADAARGLGIGALSSQLGAVTVSSVPDEQSGVVGGLQNTITNLGISMGTALTGAIVIAALSTSFLTGVQQNSAVPARVKSQASTKLAGGVPFISDKQLKERPGQGSCATQGHRRNRRRERESAPGRAARGAVDTGHLRVDRTGLQPADPCRAARLVERTGSRGRDGCHNPSGSDSVTSPRSARGDRGRDA